MQESENARTGHSNFFDLQDTSSTSSLSDIDSDILEQEAKEFSRFDYERTRVLPAAAPQRRPDAINPTVPDEYLIETGIFGRSLRPRTAVQQHPYTMEQ